MMKRVETTFTCDRCRQTATFDGVRDRLPTHWAVLSVTDGVVFKYRTDHVCLPCRNALDEFFKAGGAS